MKNDFLTLFKEAISPSQSNASQFGHRLPVIVHTSSASLNLLGENAATWCERSVFISDNTTLKANDIIGHEYDLIAFHLHKSFNPNFLAAISGTLTSGGVFLLLSTENEEIKNNPFYNYILEEINKNNHFLEIEATKNTITTKALPQFNSFANSFTNSKKNDHDQDPFAQQQKTIQAIKKVFTGRPKRPLIITANRGRGKSASLGIAIGELIQNKKPINIIITAPSLKASSVIFKHIKLTLKTTYEDKLNHVTFISPDNLIQNRPNADLLVIDEAAGLSLFTLTSLLLHYSRIVFATTLHGYEGSGQGFVTRFTKTLDTTTPQWKSITLEQPIRWAANDPLENFIEEAFMLSTVDSQDKYDKNYNQINTKIISNADLLNEKDNRSTLRSLFSLLKSAHYKTSPNDLRQLMNSDNAIIFVSYYQNTLVGAAIIEKEGGISNEIIDDIYNGYRRPKGNFIPQSIVAHLGIKKAARMTYFRVMRIAVLPDFQGKEIGSKLISSVIKHAEQEKIDFIGCSFGATNPLLKFWYNFGFNTIRIGYKKNVFSGCNAALLTRPVSTEAKKIMETASDIFSENFIAQLAGAHDEFDSSLSATILKQFLKKNKLFDIPERVQEDITSFAKHNRSYDDTLFSLKFFFTNTNSLTLLTQRQSELIIIKIFQNADWATISRKFGFSGKKQALSELKLGIIKSLEANS